MKTLAEVMIGETFNVADIEFIKFTDEGGKVCAVAKDRLFTSLFGDNNDFSKSMLLKKLENEVLFKIEAAVGAENVFEFETDLTSLCGSDLYGSIKSKISLATLDFYRKHVKIFDKYKLDRWWWLATPESTNEHYNDQWFLCVSPSGDIIFNFSVFNCGVRPFLIFNSSISVS